MKESAQPRSRRQAFALAAALTLTVLTGGAAVPGLRHAPSPGSPPVQVVHVAPAPAPAPAAPPAEEAD